MLTRPQSPIESRRRHLERVLPGYRILDIEQISHLGTDILAVIERDGRLLVDEEAHQTVTPGSNIQVDELVTQCVYGWLQQFD